MKKYRSDQHRTHDESIAPEEKIGRVRAVSILDALNTD